MKIDQIVIFIQIQIQTYMKKQIQIQAYEQLINIIDAVQKTLQGDL